jgi:hypothetical protein
LAVPQTILDRQDGTQLDVVDDALVTAPADDRLLRS